MKQLYESLRETTASLTAKFGAPVKITRNGTLVGVGHAVFTASQQRLDQTMPEHQIALTRKSMLISALQKPLQLGDLLTFQGETYTIETLEAVKPTSVTIAYRAEVVHA